MSFQTHITIKHIMRFEKMQTWNGSDVFAVLEAQFHETDAEG